jgi:Ran GTPase-activating protein (RanGAP) involved in mRNA processing and transport
MHGVLDFSGIDLSDDSLLFVIDYVTTNNLYFFERVDFKNSRLCDSNFEALLEFVKMFSNMNFLSIRDNLLPKEAGQCISDILLYKGKLDTLELSGNKLGDIGASQLFSTFSKSLNDFPSKYSISLLTLKILDLSNNDLTDPSILTLCRSLVHFSKNTSAYQKTANLQVLRLDK